MSIRWNFNFSATPMKALYNSLTDLSFSRVKHFALVYAKLCPTEYHPSDNYCSTINPLICISAIQILTVVLLGTLWAKPNNVHKQINIEILYNFRQKRLAGFHSCTCTAWAFCRNLQINILHLILKWNKFIFACIITYRDIVGHTYA